MNGKFRIHYSMNNQFYHTDFDDAESVREFVKTSHYRCVRIDLIEPHRFILMTEEEIQEMKWRISA